MYLQKKKNTLERFSPLASLLNILYNCSWILLLYRNIRLNYHYKLLVCFITIDIFVYTSTPEARRLAPVGSRSQANL